MHAGDESTALSEGYLLYEKSRINAKLYFDKVCEESTPIAVEVLAKESKLSRFGYIIFEKFWNPLDINGLIDSDGKQIESSARHAEYFAVQSSLNVRCIHVAHLDRRDAVLPLPDDSKPPESEKITIREFRPRVKIPGKQFFYLTPEREEKLSEFLHSGDKISRPKEIYINSFLATSISSAGKLYLYSDPLVQSIYFNEDYTEAEVEFRIGPSFGVANYELGNMEWKMIAIYITGVE